jgi:GAF domain-containing protein
MAEGASAQLVDAFAELSQALFAGSDADALLEHLVERATVVVEGCEFASVSVLGAGGRIHTPVATDPLVIEVDELQYDTGQGPCVEATKQNAPAIYGADVAHDERWPAFGPRAAARGIGSLISYKLAAEDTVGALNLYSRRTDAFGEADRDTAYLLALFASVVLASTQARMQATQLREALESRDVIGQAKGILMERERVTADDAFDMLRRASQHLNRKLRDLAEELAATGEEPPDLR